MMNKTLSLFVGLCCLGFVPNAVGECTVIEGAAVWLPGGLTPETSIRLEGETITEVGPTVERSGCTVIDGKGKEVSAGLVESVSQLGLVEVELEERTVDTNPGKSLGLLNDVIRPSFLVSDAYNPLSNVVAITRVEGVTSSVIQPSGGFLGGQVAWVDLAGTKQSEAVQAGSIGQVVHLGGGEGSRANTLHHLKLALNEAQTFRKSKKAWAKGASQPFRLPPVELEALYPVLDREIPLVVYVNRASEIEALMRVAAAFEVRLVLVGAAEAWLMAPELARANIPVVIDPLVYYGRSFDELHGGKDNGRLLAEAGVSVILSTFWMHNARTLRQVAGNAVREGLPKAVAMRAITEAPAKAFGMKEHGQIAVGKRANLVVWSGDPLELSTRVEHVWIGGEKLPLTSRQTDLRDRYLKGYFPARPSGP